MKKKSCLLFIFLSICSFLFAQTITVKGKVTDETGTPLPQASIFAKGVKAGVQPKRCFFIYLIVKTIAL